MACGDRYRYLAVTSSGLSLSNSFDDFASFTDFEEWKALARSLLLLSQNFKDALAAQEEVATPGSFTMWNAVNEVHARAVENYDDLPSSFLNFSPSANIGDAQTVVLDALCVIEMSEDSIVALGGTPPKAPGAADPHENDGLLTAGTKTLTTVLLAGAVVGGLVILAKGRRRR